MIKGKPFRADDFKEEMYREVKSFEIVDKKYLVVHFVDIQPQVIDLEKLFLAKVI